MAMDEEILDVVRAVLTGKMSRSVLAEMPVRPQVYAAIALMFARRSEFLERDNSLKQRYPQIIDRLLVQGLPQIREANIYRMLSSEEGLHYKNRENGRTYLTPPPELLALVVRHGCNPAIRQFFEDAAQGRREQWFQEMQEEAADGQPAPYLLQLVANLEESGGVPALVAMRAAVQARLNGIFEQADDDEGL